MPVRAKRKDIHQQTCSSSPWRPTQHVSQRVRIIVYRIYGNLTSDLIKGRRRRRTPDCCLLLSPNRIQTDKMRLPMCNKESRVSNSALAHLANRRRRMYVTKILEIRKFWIISFAFAPSPFVCQFLFLPVSRATESVFAKPDTNSRSVIPPFLLFPFVSLAGRPRC